MARPVGALARDTAVLDGPAAAAALDVRPLSAAVVAPAGAGDRIDAGPVERDAV